MDGVGARSSRPLRVSIVNSTRAWGGCEVHTEALAKALAARGHGVRVVEYGTAFLDARTQDEARSFEVIEGRPAIDFSTMSFPAAVTALRGLRGDVLVHPRPWFPSANWRFDLAARLTGAAYVTIEHSTCEPVPGASFGERIRHRVLSVAPQLVVAVSRFGAARLREVGFGESSLVVVHNGVDPARFRPDPVARREARGRWRVGEDDVVFGYAGRFRKEKGLEFALAAFARTCAAAPGARLVLVGDGAQRDALAAAAETLGITSRVTVEPFSNEVHRLYPGFDCFVLPSLTEALPLSLLEAMASGCVAIATSVGGVPEVLPDATAGWTVPPADVDALAAAMSRVLSMSSADRRATGIRARQRVIDSFDSRRQMASLVGLLEQRFAKVH
jgi:glycosyltransferase involved in cell wall biosynthesis